MTPRGDHPRSRGVYTVSAASCRSTGGSSPLARGLRMSTTDARGHTGIIPARAGFTPGIAVARRERGDHPRSRGVYVRLVSALGTVTGSSPLARGLPRPPRAHGIVDGSSPLARGLRKSTVSVAGCSGIIPARAGFTLRGPAHHQRRQDHPRSRGVYRHLRPAATRLPGSSPLARGLRRPHHLRLRHARIIPARAGFTAPSAARLHTSSDHPRSRGVYARPTRARTTRLGSSPLARGLRAAGGQGPQLRRIIPARAGFTR